MASHSNKSPYPIGSRPINADFRNSDKNSAVRRSFSGKPSVLTNFRRFDPITPANSPSGFAARHSVDSYPKEKENYERDHSLRASKFQPSAKASSKNFMAPTISAASKFSPSPKKKVLVERNDPVRTSISLSDGKAMFYSNISSNVSEDLEAKTETTGTHKDKSRAESSLELNSTNSEKNNQQAVEEGPRVSKTSKRVSFSDVPSDRLAESLSESVITESDSSKLDSSLTNEVSFSSNSSSVVAPLDADPSFPPYDPKTNYLSPRPQFLLYKPNPRVEILLSKEKGLDGDELTQLEDSLMAEILSDSEAIEDSQIETSLSEKLEDMVVGVEEEIEDRPHTSKPSESLQTVTDLPGDVSKENSVDKKEKKPWLVSRLVWFSLTLIFLIACGSVFLFHSPAFDEITLHESQLSDVRKLYQSRLSATARMKFDCFARHANQLSVNSLSFISNLVNDLGKGKTGGSSEFLNLTSLQNDGWNRGEFLNKEANKELMNDNHVVFEEDDVTSLPNDGWNWGGFLSKEVNKQLMDDNLVFEEDVTGLQNDGWNQGEFPNDEASKELMDDNLEEVAVFKEDAAVSFEMDVNVDSADNVKKGFNTQEFDLEPEDLVEDYEEEDGGDDFLYDEAIEKLMDDDLEQVAVFEEDAISFEMDVNVDSDDNVEMDVDVELEPEDLVEDYEGDDGDELEGVVDFETSSIFEERSEYQEADSDEKKFDTTKADSDDLPENKFLVPFATGLLSTLIASLFAFAAFAYHHKRNLRIANLVQENPLKLFKQTGPRFTSRNPRKQTEADAMVSEMSSYQYTAASYSRKETGGVSEAQSTEKKRKYSKRESSSESTGSPSYGSFTTFERIPIKNATNGEDEVITPVRRSSRIRNNHFVITSP